MKSVETKKGVLKYRHPNIQEGYEFLSMVESVNSGQDVFKIKSRFIGLLEPMIEWKELGYESYSEFLADRDNNATPLRTIVNEVFDDISGVLGKKD